MKNFYVFRHGETDYNKNKIAQGQSIDVELNKTGLDQAYHLADKMQNINLDIIYASPLKRALQTGEILANKQNINLKIRDNLKEGDFGILEGKSLQGASYSLLMQNDEHEYEGGESVRQMQKRFMSVLEELKDLEFENIGVATHSGLIQSLLFLLKSENKKWLKNGEVLHIQYDDGNFKIVERFV